MGSAARRQGCSRATLSPRGTLVSYAAMSSEPISIKPAGHYLQARSPCEAFGWAMPEFAAKTGAKAAAQGGGDDRVRPGFTFPWRQPTPSRPSRKPSRNAQRGGKILLDRSRISITPLMPESEVLMSYASTFFGFRIGLWVLPGPGGLPADAPRKRPTAAPVAVMVSHPVERGMSPTTRDFTSRNVRRRFRRAAGTRLWLSHQGQLQGRGRWSRKGDVLFKIDPRPYQAVYDSAVAQIKLNEAPVEAGGRRLRPRPGAKPDARGHQQAGRRPVHCRRRHCRSVRRGRQRLLPSRPGSTSSSPTSSPPSTGASAAMLSPWATWCKPGTRPVALCLRRSCRWIRCTPTSMWTSTPRYGFRQLAREGKAGLAPRWRVSRVGWGWPTRWDSHIGERSTS